MQGFEIDPDFPFNLIFFKIKKKNMPRRTGRVIK